VELSRSWSGIFENRSGVTWSWIGIFKNRSGVTWSWSGTYPELPISANEVLSMVSVTNALYISLRQF
jgi:hypothetical protein